MFCITKMQQSTNIKPKYGHHCAGDVIWSYNLCSIDREVKLWYQISAHTPTHPVTSRAQLYIMTCCPISPALNNLMKPNCVNKLTLEHTSLFLRVNKKKKKLSLGKLNFKHTLSIYLDHCHSSYNLKGVGKEFMTYFVAHQRRAIKMFWLHICGGSLVVHFYL